MRRIFVITVQLLLISVGYAMPSVMASSPQDPPPMAIDTLLTPEFDSLEYFDEWDGEVEEDDAQKILDSLIVDSLLRDIDKMTDLDEVSIYGGDIPTITRSVAPTQTFSLERIRHLRAVQVSDLLRHTAGIDVFDCGGIGGTKGFSIRGLGSQFTNLSIDGIDVSDCANGLTDLGQYLVSGNSYIYFSTAGLSTHLHTARSLAAGNAINIETEVPIFTNGQTHNVKMGFEGGSQDMVSAYMQYEQQLTQKLTATAAATYLRSNGNYPFTQYYGPTTSDTSASGNRRNSQLWQLSAEGNIFYNISRRQSFTLKTRFTRSHYNLPGRVAFYDKARPSATSEKSDYFAQFKYRARLGNWGNEDALQWQIVGKYQYHNDAYNDSSIQSLREPMRNDYQHQDGYLSTALFYKPFKPIKLSISQDGQVGQLTSNLRHNNHALRLSSYTALSASFENAWLTLNANGVGTLIYEQVDGTNKPTQNQIQNISPFVGVSIKPISSVGLRLRGFYKESYQAPSFNELYYHAPTCPFATEHALQRNIGLTFVTGQDSGWAKYIEITADYYYNRVNNRILTIPTYDFNIWKMFTFDVVDIYGIDISANATIQMGLFEFLIGGKYSYQDATDFSDPTSATYGHQIPYTPHHSASANVMIKNKWINVGWDVSFVGKRYYLPYNNWNSSMPSYIDHGLALSKKIRGRTGNILLSAHLLNLFNAQYESVRGFPMPGRNIRIAINYEYIKY